MTETAQQTQQAPSYAPGTPMWVDLSTTDVPASTRFYNQLFGWEGQDMGEEAGHYTMFTYNGKMVAAVGPIMNPGQPTAWNTYIATDNAEETARKVTEAGGKVLMAPMQVMEAGKMAVFADPTGAVFSIWQPGNHKGAELVNAPIGFGWNELHTRDMEKAKAFYTRVFPWTPKSNPIPGGGEYIEWQMNGRSVGGGQQMGPDMPENIPPNWLIYFVVPDADATIQKAQQLGGKLMMGPMDIPEGRMAVLTDPQGAAFAVIRMAR